MKTTLTHVGKIKAVIQVVEAKIAELEKISPQTPEIQRAIEEKHERVLWLNHAINEYRVKVFLAPAVKLKERANRNSQVAREKVAKKKSHKGKSLEEIRETELLIVADYQKARLATPHLSKNRWSKYHHQDYGLSHSHVRGILSKYNC